MDQKSIIQSADNIRTAIQNVEATRVAICNSRSVAVNDSLLNVMLDMHAGITDRKAAVSGEWALKEVECAREFNFELPANLSAAVQRMLKAVRTVTGAKKCLILTFDEQSGLYTCLNDLASMDGKARELSRFSDKFLQDLLETDGEVLHSYLTLDGNLVGLVAVAEKGDGPLFDRYQFNIKDQMLLDLMAPYLANKLSRFLQLKQSQSVPFIQGVVLELAGRLVNAVDQEAIIAAMLDIFSRRLEFDACQYVGFNPETGMGEVLYEVRKSSSDPAGIKVQSFSHAGLKGKRRTIRDFSNLVGLISSMARNRFYLHLHGKKLGNRSLGEIFGMRNIQSALLLPVMDIATGEIRGTFNLFRTTDAAISDESLEIAREAVQLVSQALSRALVLEKALAMALSDELTGLINRRGYYQRFEAELERARRYQTSLCVALVDVDHFKKFNDTYGHLSGDLILKTLAELFTQNMRKSDIVCRFGGEEFAILLPDTGLKSAVELMERVRQSVENMQLQGLNGETLRITISIGLSEVNTKPKVSPYRSEISDALAIADEQLYRAKNNGRNRICFNKQTKAKAVQQAG